MGGRSFGVTEHVITGFVSGTFYTSERMGMTVNSNTGSNQLFDWTANSDIEQYVELALDGGGTDGTGVADGLTAGISDSVQALGSGPSNADTLVNVSSERLGDQDFFNVVITPPAS